jgi:IS5 family transposase
VATDTPLRLLYLKHRYQLGDVSLCREGADSIGWRRFCRIALDRPLPIRPPWSSWCAAPALRWSRS